MQNEVYFVNAKNPEIMVRGLHKGDIIESSASTLFNPQDIKIGKYITINNKDLKLKIVNSKTDNTIGIITNHIFVRYKFKEVWDLFVKFLSRVPKINNIRFEIIKNDD